MKKIILAFTTLIIAVNIGNAQTTAPNDTIWKKGGLTSLNFNQVGLSNWAAGGDNSVSFNALVLGFANYSKNKLAWDNSINLGYGVTKQGDQKIQKNEDKIDFTSKAGYKISKTKWYYTFLFNFKSQFAEGFVYPNDSVVASKFGAPAYFLGSIGMDYKPNDHFSMFISPITAKLILVNDQNLADAGSFGVNRAEYDSASEKIKDGKKTRGEYGAYINAKLNKEIATNVTLFTKLELFSNYGENPQNIDVNWEVLLALKVNKYITASIYTQLIYDDDTPVPLYTGSGLDKTPNGFGPRTQFKEVIGVGFSYKFNGYTIK